MAYATDAFLHSFLPSGRNACTLVRIELTDPSAKTLYLSSREVVTPGSPPRVWQAALSDIGAVVEPGDLGAFDPGLATFDFTLSARPLAGQSASAFSLSLLASYYWYGATVTAWYWAEGISDFADTLQIFSGVVIEYETEGNQARIFCQQRNSWIVRLPANEVTRAKYPRAPEKSIGLPVPICYGDLRGVESRAPATNYDAFNQGITSISGMRRPGVRGVLAQAGKGGTGQDALVLFAGHACKLFNDDTNGATPALRVGDKLCEMDPDGALVVNASTGTGFGFDDISSGGSDPFDVFYPVPCSVSQQAGANNADNARAAIDALNETSYTLLDYDAGQREAIWPIPDLAHIGKCRDWFMVFGYLTSAGASHIVFEIVNVALATSSNISPTASLTRTVTSQSLGGAGVGPVPVDGWSWANDGAYLRARFSGTGTGETCKIFYAGLSLNVRPEWPVIANAYIVPGYVNDYRVIHTLKGVSRHNYTRREPSLDRLVPAVERVDSSEFYATLQGYADDGGGTYTGTASALIQRAPDILRHLLTTYCGETLFETGGLSGDLEDLRDDLKTWRGSDMVAAFALDEFALTSDVIRALARSCLFWPFISCLSGKWCGVAWKNGLTVDFPRRLTRYDLSGQDADSGPRIIMHRDDVQNDIHVGFGRDAWSRRSVHETFLSNARSSSGHRYRSLRDESMTVVASESDKLDFSDGTSRTVTLTTGDYTPIALAQHVAGLIAAVTTNGVCQIAWGFQIVASYNDQIAFNDGSARTATMTAGVYTGTTMATEVARAMNAASSSNWSCSYSLSTRKFTISRSSGTAQLKWGTTTSRTAAIVLGFTIADKTAGSPYAGDFAVEEERFAIGLKTSTLSLLFESGSNGIDAATPRTCGALLGFDMARDYAEGVTYALGHSPKNAREIECGTSQSRYGARPTLNVDLEYVNDTDTAREVRNRLFDIWGQPPVEIQFETERAPDLQKGMVFDFDASLDEVKPYAVPGSDGSWLGKKFIAVRVERHSLPTSHQFVVAFEVPAA